MVQLTKTFVETHDRIAILRAARKPIFRLSIEIGESLGQTSFPCVFKLPPRQVASECPATVGVFYRTISIPASPQSYSVMLNRAIWPGQVHSQPTEPLRPNML